MIIHRKDSGEAGQVHTIDNQNWVEAPAVKACFTIKHDGKNIYISYDVEEPYIRAVNTAFNSPVWEDSCVEFFFSLDGVHYYNFEINAIGTILGAYGKERNNRNWLPDHILSQIETTPSLGHEPFQGINQHTAWNLKVRIPINVLTFSNLNDLSGVNATANFYKCGDELKPPHFLSWQPVLLPSPDFHAPRYFGPIAFQ